EEFGLVSVRKGITKFLKEKCYRSY
ncbi:hypothetical protein EZS27_037487, partial [termite gut metagenome]